MSIIAAYAINVRSFMHISHYLDRVSLPISSALGATLSKKVLTANLSFAERLMVTRLAVNRLPKNNNSSNLWFLAGLFKAEKGIVLNAIFDSTSQADQWENIS